MIRILLGCLLAALVVGQPSTFTANAADVTAATSDTAPPPTPLPSDLTSAIPTAADIVAKRATIGADLDLDEATRTNVDQQLAKALENIQATEQFTVQLNTLKQELETAPQRITELQQLLVAPTVDATIVESNETTIDVAQARLKEKNDAVQAAKTRQQQIVVELDRRANRRPQLGDLRIQALKAAEEALSAIGAAVPDGEPTVVTESRLVRLNTRRVRHEREIELIDQESRTYEGTTRYWTLQRDLADRSLREAEKLSLQWQQRVADIQKAQAAKDASAAEVATAKAHPAVKSEAARNAQLAQDNANIVAHLEVSQKRLNEIENELTTRQEAFGNLKRRALASQFSQAIGVLLRNQQAALPDVDELRFRSRKRQESISELNLSLMELDVERRSLVDLDSATDTIITRIQTETNVDRRVRESIRDTIAGRLTLLGDLIENGNSYLDRLVRLDSQERELMRAISDEAGWLAEHVLWVRSADVIGNHTGKLGPAARLLTNRQSWQRVVATLKAEVRETPWWLLGGTAPSLIMLVFRRHIKAQIRDAGTHAQRANCVRFFDTVKASVLTMLLAGTLPCIVWLVGWRLSSRGLGDQFVESVGAALRIVAGCWFLVDVIRSVSQIDGICEDHFEWPVAALATVRRSTHLLAVGLLPSVFILSIVEYLGDEPAIVSLGRIAYLLAMGLLTVAMFRIFRPSGKVFQSLESRPGNALLIRFRWLASGVLIASPGILAMMSAIGYHYTAIQLTGRLLASLSVGFTLVFLNGLASRWLLIAYRRMAMQRAREKRMQMQAQQEAGAAQPAATEVTPELKLADINSQATRVLRLVFASAALTVLYLTWVDVLPALGVLQKIPLWKNYLVAADGMNDIEWVTAADLTFSAFIAALTLFAARNLPGLLEMTVLQRLPLDAGARYAATTVSRYLIVVVGISLCFHEVGVGWVNVQWLIAAMTVGLGFGLQEIFANFVSGIILLFERPIRLGDTVTIGTIHGTVSRIRIRATTIVDWDNKELIVPNKEFVTGHLVNWTLTTPTLRLIVKVGVAYGSNTRLTTQLLYRVAQENEDVLEDPEPVVVFKEFGDSALNFELRVFVNGLPTFRRLNHDLHMAIDDVFRDHGIEIAFPQRDLHLRTIPAELLDLVLPAQLPVAAQKRNADPEEHKAA